MAIHYFDVDDNGSVFYDDQGTDCPDFDFVKNEAISALVDMVRETLPDGDHHKISVKVRSEGGEVVLHVALNFDVVKERHPSGGSTSTPDRHV
ncbi:hypothetical protein EJ076_33575 [Mesorhizobium sp. M7D.F.Ca.US.005.01.1.1]|jgi:hypothetical protein|uniref:DUF6894 family protein n=1 Tax=Mesorhizobium sp. M7D.F.Ca.US.005.01.1.1 TaxID=2493678 RepID=UPI000F7549B4|nr:hypothetical protein [Mesorhizobium sp. M7D.F.Ca.US.005.01.1.1]AZO45656.1 hypothetical protein EJ076_33575 [Mesorhizobium sp. M7D.F.Ca.US.005.01.1.1]